MPSRDHTAAGAARANRAKVARCAHVLGSSGKYRDGGALCRALSQITGSPRGTTVQQADHRHRADRLRSVRLPATAIIVNVAERLRDGVSSSGNDIINFQFTRSRSIGVRRRRSIATSLISASLKCSMAIRSATSIQTIEFATRPRRACLMAAATVNLPAIAFSVNPMGKARRFGERNGLTAPSSRTRQLLAARRDRSIKASSN